MLLIVQTALKRGQGYDFLGFLMKSLKEPLGLVQFDAKTGSTLLIRVFVETHCLSDQYKLKLKT